jgi:phospholipid/cholesterol/gamma-HCH transport system substrate-binding protein
MPTRLNNNIKLGTFVMGGLLFLVLMLYMIGKNRNLFGSTYVLKARFENIQGLVAGNNVRYAGINTGTVKKISILNDTTIEVTMILEKKMLEVVHKNAIASIGTEGLVGNKVLNITPNRQPAALAVEGDILDSKKIVSTDEMLQKLANTNNDVSVIADNLKIAIQRVNNSTALWTILNDNTLPQSLRASATNVKLATAKADHIVENINGIVNDVKNGKGSLGIVLRDTSLAKNLNDAIVKIKNVGAEAETVTVEINKIINGIEQDINNGKGTANAVLKDSLIVVKLHSILNNIEKSTDGFNQNMEALKHNFLLRGYFKKLEKQKKKEIKNTEISID